MVIWHDSMPSIEEFSDKISSSLVRCNKEYTHHPCHYASMVRWYIMAYVPFNDSNICFFMCYIAIMKCWLTCCFEGSIHNPSWISQWIKSISNELDITYNMPVPQSFCLCSQLWNHQENVNRKWLRPRVDVWRWYFDYHSWVQYFM